jgi:hypothetical protein
MSMENEGRDAAGVADGQGDRTGAGREWFPPAAIVVIHGVGDHKEDEAARELGEPWGGRCTQGFAGPSQPTSPIAVPFRA